MRESRFLRRAVCRFIQSTDESDDSVGNVKNVRDVKTVTVVNNVNIHVSKGFHEVKCPLKVI